jgi:hypothetical protein
MSDQKRCGGVLEGGDRAASPSRGTAGVPLLPVRTGAVMADGLSSASQPSHDTAVIEMFSLPPTALIVTEDETASRTDYRTA